MLWRSQKSPEYRKRLFERLGRYEFPVLKESIWMHAVSVGEVQAALPLVKNLQLKYPNTPIVFTTQTPTGSERVKKIFGSSIYHCYIPFDVPHIVNRFMRHVNPKLAVIMETEIWPSLYHACNTRSIPLAIASARISPKSIHSYRRFAFFFKSTLDKVNLIAAQTSRDAGRFIELGARPENVKVIGNLKFDFMFMPSDVADLGLRYRISHLAHRPVIIAASTHEGEEELVLNLYKDLSKDYHNLCIILVPRHPERFESVINLVRVHKLNYVTRSSQDEPNKETQVLIVNTLGELPIFYAAADIAIVGGSFVPIGGHNLLEPAALSLPILVGEHTFNAPEITEMLEEVRALKVIRNTSELSLACREFLSNTDKLKEAGLAGKEVVSENHGALQKILVEIENIYPQGS